MKKALILVATAISAFACNPSIPSTPVPAQIRAVFTPDAVPPVLPLPTDLAQDPTTGLLNIPLSKSASPADQEFAAYLDTLNGYPADTPATCQFTGALKASSVTSTSVQVLDLTQGTNAAATLTYTDTPSGGQLTIFPSTGWSAGHAYAVVLIGGANADGLTGAGGEQVVGSNTWWLVRASNSLVAGCTDLKSPTCQASTSLIPSAAAAVQLEQLRLHYKPILDKVVSGGVSRSDIVLAWSFKIADFTEIAFNPAATPPLVPTPNDLAINPATGLVNAPVDPASPPAQQEFITDYVNTLDGFVPAVTASTSVVGGTLDAATVNAASVLVIDLTLQGPVAGAGIAYDSTANAIGITAPGGAWQKGHHYGVAVLSGTGNITANSGKPVVGSDIWALVRSKASLVSCANPSDPTTCASALTLAPLSTAQALELEQLRLAYAPILDGFEANGIPRSSIALLWTFQIASFPVTTFDPANNVIPFPNDLLLANRGTANQHVNLPIPDGGPTQALFQALDTLDGFANSTPVVSENSDTLGPIDQGDIDPTTLAAGGANLVNLNPSGLPAQVIPCVSCASPSALLPDGGAPAIPQLQLVPKAPLEERTTYAAYVTSQVKDTSGKPLGPSLTFALARLKNSLLDANNHSTVTGVSDAQAAALEPLRLGLKPLIDGLVAQGIPRSQLALAWTFTTQSTVSTLSSLHGLPAALSLPTAPAFAVDITTQVLAQMAAAGLPDSHIGHVFTGELTIAFLLTGPGGTIDPSTPIMENIPFLLTEPATSAPASGYPVLIFGHGLTRSRLDLLALADSLAAGGYAGIAIDAVWHGDRSFCAGSHVATGQASDDASCASPSTQMCDATPTSPTYGRCIARPPATGSACNPSAVPPAVPGDLACASLNQGRCLGTGTAGACEGGDFLRDSGGRPVISGWNFANPANFFNTRDNFREPVVDLAQLARVVPDSSLSGALVAQGGGALNGADINYAGQSLGGFYGSLYNAVAGESHQAVLNVPGGGIATALLTSPGFAPLRTAFLAGLAQAGVVPGTPAFDDYIGLAQWVLDAGDPLNAAYALRHGSSIPTDRHVLIQYVQGDQTVPNPTTLALIGAANQVPGEPSPVAVTRYSWSLPSDPHGFLLNFADPATTVAAQTELVTFITSPH